MLKISFKDIANLSSTNYVFGIEKNWTEIFFKNIVKYYIKMKIPKKTKGYRTFYQAHEPLARLHKNILSKINKTIETNQQNFISANAHGFIQNRSTKTNAKQHIGHKFLLTTDIEKFFKSISTNDIIKVFKNLGCNDNIAQYFTKLCTIIGVLEEGLNANSMIANLFFYETDMKIEELSNFIKINKEKILLSSIEPKF